MDRAVIRERRVSCPVELEWRWRERYVPSQQFYFATVCPTDHANIIVHNDESSSRSGRPNYTNRNPASARSLGLAAAAR